MSHDYLPTPLTNRGSTATDIRDDSTATPPRASSQAHHRTPSNPEQPEACSSPGDTQALSQFVYPPRAFADEVGDEAAEGVWGYLIPLNDKVRHALVLRKRDGCRDRAGKTKPGKNTQWQTKDFKGKSSDDLGPPGGYLIGRHPECGK